MNFVRLEMIKKKYYVICIHFNLNINKFKEFKSI